MTVIFVGAGPGDPELLTVKAQRLLRECRVCVYAGSLVSPQVLALLPAGAARHDSASMHLEEIVTVFRRAHENDVDVVRLHTGDPSIYGAINEQMRELETIGIPYEVVPGVSAFQAAAASWKTELTEPGGAQTIIISRVAGRTPVPEAQSLEALARTGATLCLYLSVHKIGEIANTLSPHYGADCPVVVVFHASWPDERTISGTLEDIADRMAGAEVSRTAVVLVGRALGREGEDSKLYDRTFTHGFRQGE
jgi:precorrin-4/cobalt-precorrin-4 C11-methyltransferase